MEDYRTIHGTATGEYEEKKSRFIAALSFADSEEAAVAAFRSVGGAVRHSVSFAGFHRCLGSSPYGGPVPLSSV